MKKWFLPLIIIVSFSFQTVDQEEFSMPIDEKSDSEIIAELNEIMDNWHKAAATANAEAFFGRMSADGIYIGTDISERWRRDELRSWAKSAFERESAWTFTASERNWHSIGSGVWIGDEVLKTWMGPCRSTMVLKKNSAGQWLIHHYQLSVTVPNDRIKDFKKLLEMD
jgi:ketosteroid isomerase-like protein